MSTSDIKPQKGTNSLRVRRRWQLRKGDVRRSDFTAAQFDHDCSFMLLEVSSDDLFFQAISRTGTTVDSAQVTLVMSRALRFVTDHSLVAPCGATIALVWAN
jgi:hypothetical protein